MSNILITGANSGFGLLTTRTFAQAGHTVHAGFRSKARAGELEALANQHPGVRPVRLDFTEADSIGDAVAEAQTAGPIDVLVNNAGYELSGAIDSLSEDALTRQFDTNVFDVVRMIRAVAPEMRSRKQGAIINLSSIPRWPGRLGGPHLNG